eukprot:scpid91643/ scgid31859/ 
MIIPQVACVHTIAHRSVASDQYDHNQARSSITESVKTCSLGMKMYADCSAFLLRSSAQPNVLVFSNPPMAARLSGTCPALRWKGVSCAPLVDLRSLVFQDFAQSVTAFSLVIRFGTKFSLLSLFAHCFCVLVLDDAGDVLA